MNTELFARIRVVLVRPQHPGNIGAAARAMGIMGLTKLYLVAPREFPHPQADAMATSAQPLLAQAQVVTDVPQALSDTCLAIGFSSRRREIPMPAQWVAESMTAALSMAQQGEVALVFGNEATGLDNQELILCQVMTIIPTQGHSESLNLAAAVQVAAYELCKQSARSLPLVSAESPPATFTEREGLIQSLGSLVALAKFQHPERVLMRLRRLFARSGLEQDEVNLLRGLLKERKNRTAPEE